MPPTTSFRPGDVVLVRFLFTDGTGVKQRPAVVVSGPEYNGERPDAVMVAITSQRVDRAGDFELGDWRGAGLIKPSWVKAVIQTIEQGTIQSVLGRLTDGDLARIKYTLRNVLAL